MELSAIVDHLALGASTAISPGNLLWCLVGVLLGTAIGVLPGVGPVATMALILPLTYHVPPESALIMLAGIYYGAQYGGSTTSILVNIPGESSSVITCLDGHQMAKNGRAGPALAIAAIASFIAGCVATVFIALAAPPLALLAQQFAPADYCSLMLLGLVLAIILSQGSIVKAIGMILLGLLLGTVGTDIRTGDLRFTFGFDVLFDGLGFAIVSMGLFGIADVMHEIGNTRRRDLAAKTITGLMPRFEDLKASAGAIARGTAMGSFLGVLPGGGATLASFAAYSTEKKISRYPERFGTGVIEGVAAPESANNAASQTNFVPLLTLGIPSGGVMAMMAGAMMIHGIVPGPQVMTERPALFWGVIVSMWIGNLMLVVINLPLIGIWVRMLSIPYRNLAIAILCFCCIGGYSIGNQPDDILILAFFGVAGYFLRRLGCELAPFLLGFVLGPMIETYLRRALLLSNGDPAVFIQRPLSIAFLSVAAVLLLFMIMPKVRQARDHTFEDEKLR